VLASVDSSLGALRADLTMNPPALSGPYHSDVRADLLRALALGGAFTTDHGAQDGRREFCAPYAYSSYPRLPGDLQDATGDGLAWPVLGTNVAVRDQPSIKARIIARLDYNLVPVSSMDLPDKSGAAYVWEMVNLPKGGSATWKPHCSGLLIETGTSASHRSTACGRSACLTAWDFASADKPWRHSSGHGQRPDTPV
jgi:hypothetical protein